MDSLRAEIASKRKTLQDGGSSRPRKYMRKGDLHELKELSSADANVEQSRAPPTRPTTDNGLKLPDLPASTDSNAGPFGEPDFNVSQEETIRRLRSKGQPIRLFGETDKDRRLRLRALELIEERDSERQGGQNDFKRALEDVENKERAQHDNTASPKKRREVEDTTDGPLDITLVRTNPDRVYPLIYFALKKMLKDWADAMDQRPEHVKRSTQGKMAAATQIQSAENLKPLFKSLRSRALAPDVLLRMAEIVHYMQARQYQKANDSYLRLSIGNAAWPIGVTMVGIHERSAREKISSDQVAHVLNDEVSRKYIQCIKRLLTFAQTAYPPDDISQLMG